MAEFDHWMRLNIGDFLADTLHLTALQIGIYTLLIMHCFKCGSLPGDERDIARIARCSAVTWRRASPAVMAKFQHAEDGWRHKRVDAERKEAMRISELRRQAGSEGAEARWNDRREVRNDESPGESSLRTSEAPQTVENTENPNGKSNAFAIPPTTTTTKQEIPPYSPPKGGGARKRARGRGHRKKWNGKGGNGSGADRPDRNAAFDVLREMRDAREHSDNPAVADVARSLVGRDDDAC